MDNIMLKKVSKQFLKKTLQDLVTNYKGSYKNSDTELLKPWKKMGNKQRGQIDSGKEHLKKDLRKYLFGKKTNLCCLA